MLTNTPTVPVAGELDENERIVMAKTIVAGDMYQQLDGQLFEIKRQLRQPDGYPFDPQLLKLGLQQIIEGKFNVQEGRSVILSSPLFKTSDTNLNQAIENAEKFTRKVLGITIEFKSVFDLPSEIPWKNVMVIYDPGLNNREAVEKTLQGQKLKVYEESDVMQYSGSSASSLPTLCIVENSLRPSEDTLGSNAKSPDQLNADGRNYLDIRGYTLAFGQRYFISKDYLDPQTWTWFPKNRLPSGKVAYGYWSPNPYCRRVRFDWRRAGRIDGNFGARLAMSIPLKS